MKRKVFFGMIMMSWSLCCSAQVTIQLLVNPNPPAKLSEWGLKGNTLTLIVTNLLPASQNIVIYSEIKTNSGDVVATRILIPGFFQTIPAGVTIFSVKDVIPLNQMSFAGSYRSGLQRTGKLPQGSYIIGVQLNSPLGPPLTPLVRSDFTLAGIQLPILFAPYDNQQLSAVAAQTAITFRWTNVIKSSGDIPSYNLQVFEVLPRQKTMQALRANQPLLNVIIKGNTQYIWRPQLLFNDSLQHKFIWTIRTTDGQGNLYSITDANAEGRSEPKVFVIANALKH